MAYSINQPTTNRFVSVCMLLPAILTLSFLSGCGSESPEKRILSTNKLFDVVADDKTITWPVGVDVFVDDELIHQYRILFSFKTVKDVYGRSQYVYASHRTETIGRRKEGEGFSFPSLSVKNYFVDMEAGDGDLTRYWETDIDFTVYFSDAAIKHDPEVRKWSQKNVITYYNDWVDLGNAFGRHFDHRIKIRNGFLRDENSWHLPEIGFTGAYTTNGTLNSRNIVVKIHAKSFN